MALSQIDSILAQGYFIVRLDRPCMRQAGVDIAPADGLFALEGA